VTPPRDDTGQAGGESAPGPLGPAELQLLLLFSNTLTKQVKAQVDAYKHDLVTGTGDPNVDMTSGETKHVHLQDENGEWHKVGTVRVDRAPVNVVVTDEAALTRWVEANMPGGTVTTVRKSTLEAMKAQMKEHGGVVLSGGEVVTVPGLEIEHGDPKVVVVPAKGAAETFGRVYRDGRLPQAGAVLGRALEVGEGPPPK
jgi:hypothetical protein